MMKQKLVCVSVFFVSFCKIVTTFDYSKPLVLYQTDLDLVESFDHDFKKLFIIANHGLDEKTFLKEQEKKITNFKEIEIIELYDFASQAIRRIDMSGSNKIRKLVVTCNEREQIEWLEKEIEIKKFVDLFLYNFASKIVSKLTAAEENAIKTLSVVCYHKEHVSWLQEVNDWNINVKNVFLFKFASQMLTTLKEEKTIETLSIKCNNEEEMEWIDQVEKIKHRKIKNWFLYSFASEIISKLAITDEGVFEKLKMVYFSEREIRWINKKGFARAGNDILSFFLHERKYCFCNIAKQPSYFVFKWKKSLADKQISELDKEKISLLTKNQISVLTKKQIQNLSEKQLSFFTKKQLFWLDDEQVSFFTTEQFLWFKKNAEKLKLLKQKRRKSIF